MATEPSRHKGRQGFKEQNGRDNLELSKRGSKHSACVAISRLQLRKEGMHICIHFQQENVMLNRNMIIDSNAKHCKIIARVSGREEENSAREFLTSAHAKAHFISGHLLHQKVPKCQCGDATTSLFLKHESHAEVSSSSEKGTLELASIAKSLDFRLMSQEVEHHWKKIELKKCQRWEAAKHP